MTDIFISYSHKDEAWKDALQRHLRVLQMQNQFAIWDDRQIEVGSNWLPAIECAIEQAKVALLLVSSDFLTSEFVTRKEIPRLLQRREAEGLQVVPIIVHPCAWETVEWLQALQGGTTDNRPLSQFALGSFQSEHDFREITLKVYKLLQTAQQAEQLKRIAEASRRAEQERLEQEHLKQAAEQQRLAQEQVEREAIERARQAELQRQHELAEQAKREQLAQEKAQAAERTRLEQAQHEQAAVERAEKERLVREQAALKRQEREQQKAQGGGHKPKWLWSGISAAAVAGVVVWAIPDKKPDHAVVQPTTTESAQIPVTEPAKPTIALPKMIPIQGDSFEMGCKEGRDDVEGGCQDDEKPLHSVKIADFAMSQTEITRGQFRAFVEKTGYKTTAEQEGSCWGDKTGKGDWGDVEGNSWLKPGFEQTDEHPVVCMSWQDTQAFITWLNQVDKGKNYRLPTEAEWEYAARGGNQKHAYPWGQAATEACNYANVADQTAKKTYSEWTVAACDDVYLYTAAVGRFKPNRYNLLDMHGNVWEWVQDCYHASYKSAPKDGSAWQEKDCEKRVLRGGSWNDRPQGLRSAYRSRDFPTTRFINIGFRISRTL